jgi:Domain of unknown function (DUF5658)
VAEARLRETKFLMSFDISKLNKRLMILLSVFITLNFFDAVSTLIALHAGPEFMELNPIASGLFQHSFAGFVAAMSLKYMPMIPLAYVTFLSGDGSKGVALRIVKVSAFVALVAADIFYAFVVGSNSLNLFSYFVWG